MDIGISGNVALRVRLVENGTSLTETGLEAGMSYFFEVFAVGNSTGQGVGATPLHLQTLLGEHFSLQSGYYWTIFWVTTLCTVYLASKLSRGLGWGGGSKPSSSPPPPIPPPPPPPPPHTHTPNETA